MLKQKRYTAVVLLVLALIATVFYLFPLVLVLTNSQDHRRILPAIPSACLRCFSGAITAMPSSRCHFLTSLRNSLVITVCVCALIALLGAMAATRSAVCGISSFPPSIT